MWAGRSSSKWRSKCVKLESICSSRVSNERRTRCEFMHTTGIRCIPLSSASWACQHVLVLGVVEHMQCVHSTRSRALHPTHLHAAASVARELVHEQQNENHKNDEVQHVSAVLRIGEITEPLHRSRKDRSRACSSRLIQRAPLTRGEGSALLKLPSSSSRSALSLFTCCPIWIERARSSDTLLPSEAICASFSCSKKASYAAPP